MKAFVCILLLSVTSFAGVSLVQVTKNRETIAVDQTLIYFKQAAEEFKSSVHRLDAAIEHLNVSDKNSRGDARKCLIEARAKYKGIEFFVEYFFDHTANIYNRSPSYEIDAAGLEYEDPIGLQVIEELLADQNPGDKQDELRHQSKALTNNADDIASLLYNLKITDAQILESVRLELLRISTLGVTGYDAPYLKTGLTESRLALNALTRVLQPFLETANRQTADSVTAALHATSGLVTGHPDFDSFDRLRFFSKGIFPLQYSLSRMIRELGLDVNSHSVVNYDEENFFSPGFFNKRQFLPAKKLPTPDEIELGKKLFFDKNLSANKTRSCATCHQPEKYFSDGLKTNTSLSGTPIKRNSPSLLYAVYQYAQFLDGRENDLKAQAEKVISNATEMNGNPHNIVALIRKKPAYIQLFKAAYPHTPDALTFETVASAISAYETTLTPFTSAFDRYMAGDEAALTRQQQLGFNLFTGKAKCATCHFLPLFNGLVPPLYQVTEFETLGVPATGNLAKPRPDKDSGRYYTVPLPYTIGSFKIPTVRNSSATAPYMHNGSLGSLEKLMDFYNKGGGRGIGLKISYQTLSSAKLNLTQTEIKAVISFIHALTDKSVKTRHQKPA